MPCKSVEDLWCALCKYRIHACVPACKMYVKSFFLPTNCVKPFPTTQQVAIIWPIYDTELNFDEVRDSVVMLDISGVSKYSIGET